jgi:hypothetical protein
MNVCACIVGDVSFPSIADVSIFRYQSQTPHFIVIRDAMERGFTTTIVLDGAIFDERKLFILPSILRQIQMSKNQQCVFLGGEQYGPLISMQTFPLFSIKKCTITHCSHAYVLRYSGMRKMINRKTVKPNVLTWQSYNAATVVPSIASAQSCPRWVTKLPKLPMIPKFDDHRKFQAFLEADWQAFLKSVIGYLLFTIVSGKIKQKIVDNCT